PSPARSSSASLRPSRPKRSTWPAAPPAASTPSPPPSTRKSASRRSSRDGDRGTDELGDASRVGGRHVEQLAPADRSGDVEPHRGEPEPPLERVLRHAHALHAPDRHHRSAPPDHATLGDDRRRRPPRP